MRAHRRPGLPRFFGRSGGRRKVGVPTTRRPRWESHASASIPDCSLCRLAREAMVICSDGAA